MDVDALQEALGYRFADTGLLHQALTHRSAASINNERLEFLGDGVLNFVVAHEVFQRRSEAPEGELSRLRATLVNKQSLAALARDMGLGDAVHLGTGELKSGGHRRDSILADGLEALFGAVLLDGGFTACKRAIQRVYRARLANLPGPAALKDPKTRLQEHLQALKLPLPAYGVLAVDGRAHEQTFRVECRVEGLTPVAEGESSSRRKAEQAAAAEMLQRLQASGEQ